MVIGLQHNPAARQARAITTETTVIDALATFRLARLITEDTLPPIRKARTWIWERWPPNGATVQTEDDWKLVPPEQPQWAHRWHRFLGIDMHSQVRVMAGAVVGDAPVDHAVVLEAHPLGELVSCPWCVSAHLSTFVVCARRFAPGVWDPIARILAFSAVAGIIASRT